MACGAVPRRIVARAVSQVRGDAIKEQVTDLQYAVGRKCGIEAMHKSITANAEAAPDLAIVSVDFSSAFTRIRRRKVLRALERRCPDLAALFASWYERSTKHVVAGAGSPARVVEQEDGLDQGCPMSPAFFALGIADQLVALLARLRAVDSRCRIWSFLDDIYFTCPKLQLKEALQCVHELFQPLGLELNVLKTKLWCPDGALADVPAELKPLCGPCLPCLGSTVGFVRQRVQEESGDEWREICVGIADAGAPQKAADRLQAFGDRLVALHKGGLELQHIFIIMRSWCNAAFTHYQRATLAPEGDWRKVDDVLTELVQAFVGKDWKPWSRSLLFLPAKEGGLGFRSAETSADAAWAASWHAVEEEVRRNQGASSSVEAELQTPVLTAAVANVKLRLSRSGACLVRNSKGDISQKGITKLLLRKLLVEVRSSLPEAAAALMRSHGGSGSLLLASPTNRYHCIPDEEFVVAMRERLLVEDPAGHGKRRCQNIAKTKQACTGSDHGCFGLHARNCEIGPGFVRRHHSLRDAHGAWLQERHGTAAVEYEQRVPAWDQTTDQGTKIAVLDVAMTGPGGRQYIDVTVIDPLAAGGSSIKTRAIKPGTAARDREREKHQRYPGPQLVAAAVEAGGRLGTEFESFLKAQAPAARTAEERAARVKVLQDGRMRVVIAAVRGTAAMLLSAAGAAPRPWR